MCYSPLQLHTDVSEFITATLKGESTERNYLNTLLFQK